LILTFAILRKDYTKPAVLSVRLGVFMDDLINQFNGREMRI